MGSAERVLGSARNGFSRAAQAHDGMARDRLAEFQRTRILAAMYEVVAERGAGNVSVAHVVERSGVSRRTFYELFVDREDCFLWAFERALSCARERVLHAYGSGGTWRERIRAGLLALLSFLDEEPSAGRLLVVESLAGGSKALRRRGEVIAELTSVVEEGAVPGRRRFTQPHLTGEGVVGGVLAVIQSRLAERSDAPLVGLTNPLMSMIVLPYLGVGAARRELERAAPQPSFETGERPRVGDPFKEAGMRLTYRTTCVLIAIREHPGASNRLIAEITEIKDQAQVSKLLKRLHDAGVVWNRSAGPGQGAPNAWCLTPSGQTVVDSVRSHPGGRG